MSGAVLPMQGKKERIWLGGSQKVCRLLRVVGERLLGACSIRNLMTSMTMSDVSGIAAVAVPLYCRLTPTRMVRAG
jgi:hypothetical protein